MSAPAAAAAARASAPGQHAVPPSSSFAAAPGGGGGGGGAAAAATRSLYECSLFGLVGGAAYPVLRDRLASVCVQGTERDCWEHQLVYVPTVQTEVGPARSHDVVLRVKTTRQQSDGLGRRGGTLHLFGPAQGRNVAKCCVRPVTEVDIAKNWGDFVSALGYRFEYEFVKTGVVLVFDNQIQISLTKVLTFETRHDPSSLSTYGDPDSWVVQASTIRGVPREHVPAVDGRLDVVRSLLSSLVTLQHVDVLALQSKIFYS